MSISELYSWVKDAIYNVSTAFLNVPGNKATTDSALWILYGPSRPCDSTTRTKCKIIKDVDLRRIASSSFDPALKRKPQSLRQSQNKEETKVQADNAVVELLGLTSQRNLVWTVFFDTRWCTCSQVRNINVGTVTAMHCNAVLW